MTKTREDNDMIDPTRVAYAENKIELSWPIGLSLNCDEKLIEQ